MKIFKLILGILLFCLPSIGLSEDLLCVYDLAHHNDPTLNAARAAQLAASEAYPQARALFLPLIALSASNTYYDKRYFDTNTVGIANILIPLTTKHFFYDQNVVGLTLSQPIFYYQQWVQLSKACDQVKQANATYAAAEQDLMVRTVQRYFEVLRAMDNLKYLKAQDKALANILEQSKQKNKAGLLTFKDLQMAQARYDNAHAQIISAENTLLVQKVLLREITGQFIECYATLNDDLQFCPPDPECMDAWISKALDQNYNLQAARFQLESVRQDIKLNKANHLPTISVNGAVIRSTSVRDIFSIPKNSNAYIGFQVNMPLFNGGSVLSKTRQARYLFEQSLQQTEGLQRQTESNTIQAFQGVLTQISQIKALKQSVISNRLAFEAASAFSKAGTSTIIDVLNAQSDFTQTQQNYSNAKYNYIIQSILLKQAAGTLCPEDIIKINHFLDLK